MSPINLLAVATVLGLLAVLVVLRGRRDTSLATSDSGQATVLTAETAQPGPTEPDLSVAVVDDLGADAPAARARRGLWGRRSRRSETPDAPEAEDPVDEGDDEGDEEPDQPVDVTSTEVTEPPLEHDVDGHTPPTRALALVADSEDRFGGQEDEDRAAAYLRQVTLVIRGLSENTSEEESPLRTLARVAAAVERLGAPDGMERPVLPLATEPAPRPRASGSWAPTHRRETPELPSPSVAPAAVQPEPVQPEPVQPEPVQHAAVHHAVAAEAGPAVRSVAPETQVESRTPVAQSSIPEPASTAPMSIPLPERVWDEDDLPVGDLPEIVLPVPPPAVADAPQARRRRLLRSHSA